MSIRNRTIAIVLTSAMAAGCATMEMSEENKGALGAAVGAIAGVFLAKEAGASDWQAILAGAAIGYAGYRIGKHLSRNDEAALQRRTAAALASSPDGQTVEWHSDESDAKALITTRNSRQERKEIDILRDRRVTTPPPIDVIGMPYVSVGSSVNLRAGPSTDTQVVGSLNRGEVVHAIGKVRGAPWVMIGKNDIAMGYVHESLVTEYDETAAQQQQALTGIFDLDEVDIDEINRQAGATFELDDFVAVGDTIEVNTDCRTVDFEFVADEEVEGESLDACRGPNGAWQTWDAA